MPAAAHFSAHVAHVCRQTCGWDPANNALNTKVPAATLSGSEYEDWWRIWEAAGWLSLGRARNFDWMRNP